MENKIENIKLKKSKIEELTVDLEFEKRQLNNIIYEYLLDNSYFSINVKNNIKTDEYDEYLHNTVIYEMSINGLYDPQYLRDNYPNGLNYQTAESNQRSYNTHLLRKKNIFSSNDIEDNICYHIDHVNKIIKTIPLYYHHEERIISMNNNKITLSYIDHNSYFKSRKCFTCNYYFE